MSQSVVVNGVTYTIPDVDDEEWGQNVTDYLVAISVVASATQSFMTTVNVTSSPVTVTMGRTYLVDTSAARTLQLPAAASNFYFIVKDKTGGAASFNITIARAGSELIDGVAGNKTLARPYGTWILVSDGTNWFTINEFPDTGIINADIASAAAIAYSKLNLALSIVNADVSVSAAIAHAKMAALTASVALVSDGSGIVAASSVTSTELAGLHSLTASRAVVTTAGGILTTSAVTSTELGYLSGVTSAIQTQIDLKAPLASPTFSGTITTPLTASRALTTGASSQLAVSATTSTELGYLSGVTSAIQTQLNTNTPVGTIQMYGAASAPTGWQLCDGSGISRSTFSALFAIIGTTFGIGDGSTTFNVPDFRGVFPKGAGTTSRTLGKDASGNFYAGTLGTYLTDKMQGHKHTVYYQTNADYARTAASVATQILNSSLVSSSVTSDVPVTDGTNGTPRTGLTTEPQSLGITFIIKT